jgi:hypothetical protein
MGERDFWRLEHFSDGQLLERLQSALRTQRFTLAELVAHLGEIEERRLHLAAAHGSLFSYCVQQLGMSEDEACRRIELSRLARRYPVLFSELASGRISLSVALILKPVLTPHNHAELIAAARGASLRTARELLAARFPSPDVPSRMRKLPQRLGSSSILTAAVEIAVSMPAAASDVTKARPAAVGAVMPALGTCPGGTIDTSAAVGAVMPARVTTASGTADTTTAPALTSSPQPPRGAESEARSLAALRAQGLLQAPPTLATPSPASPQAASPDHADPRPQQRIDPLSAERYRVVFTADASLKQKLELARDLLRHSHPSGDFALIVSRALDLLLQDLAQRRFGARRKDPSQPSARLASQTVPAASSRQTPPSSTPPVPAPAPVRPVASAAPRIEAQPSTMLPVATLPPERRVTPPIGAGPLSEAPSNLAAPFVAPPPATAPCIATPFVAPPFVPAPAIAAPPVAPPPVAPPPVAPPPATAPCIATPFVAPPSIAAPSVAPSASGISRAARRVVLARDGLGCCWVNAEGHRCGSTAWLELDHQHPSGKGGRSEPENLRLLCRAHNRFAAECAYGRDHVERAIRARQRSAKRRCQGGRPPSSQAPA